MYYILLKYITEPFHIVYCTRVLNYPSIHTFTQVQNVHTIPTSVCSEYVKKNNIQVI